MVLTSSSSSAAARSRAAARAAFSASRALSESARKQEREREVALATSSPKGLRKGQPPRSLVEPQLRTMDLEDEGANHGSLPASASGEDDILANGKQAEAEDIAAATKIQAVQRGKAERRRMQEGGGGAETADAEPEDIAAATKIQAVQRGKAERRRMQEGGGGAETADTEETVGVLVDAVSAGADDIAAATKIQAVQRGKAERRRMQKDTPQLSIGSMPLNRGVVIVDVPEEKVVRVSVDTANAAAMQIQSVQCGNAARRVASTKHDDREMAQAAMCIQSRQRGRSARRNLTRGKREDPSVDKKARRAKRETSEMSSAAVSRNATGRLLAAVEKAIGCGDLPMAQTVHEMVERQLPRLELPDRYRVEPKLKQLAEYIGQLSEQQQRLSQRQTTDDSIGPETSELVLAVDAEITTAEQSELERSLRDQSLLDSSLSRNAAAPQGKSVRRHRHRSRSRSQNRELRSARSTSVTSRPPQSAVIEAQQAGYKVQPIELSFACIDVPRMDTTGSLMPIFAVLWLWRKSTRRWHEHGRTEVVRDPQPNFVRSFYLDYVDHSDNFTDKQDQWSKVELYQRKTHLADLARHAKIGEAIFTLRDVHKVPIKRLTLPLRVPVQSPTATASGRIASPVALRDPYSASVVIRLAEIMDTVSPGHVEFTYSAAAGLSKQSSTFLQGSRYVQGDWEVFHRSDVQRGNEVRYGSFNVSLVRVCLNDLDAYLKFEVRELGDGGEHRLVGAVETSLRNLLDFSKATDAPGPSSGSITGRAGRMNFQLDSSPPTRGVAHALAVPMKPVKVEDGKVAPKITTPQLTLAVLLHQSRISDIAEEESGGGWETDDITDGGPEISIVSQNDECSATESTRKPKQQRPRRKRWGNAEAGAALYADDANFLAGLLADANIRETDLKDIVGDGINFINERQSNWQNRVGKERADRASSIYDRRDEQEGIGYFLEGPAGVTGLPNLNGKSTRKVRGRKKQQLSKEENHERSVGNESPESAQRSNSALPGIGERSDLMSTSTIIDSASPELAERGRTWSKSSLAGTSRSVRRRRPKASSPDQLPKLNVTSRMELLSMDPKKLGLRKPKPRRSVPETADELQRRRLDEGKLGAIATAINSTPTQWELQRQHKRNARRRIKL